MLHEFFSFIKKCLHFLFKFCDNCFCMPIYLAEIFPRKSSVLSVFLCNSQFYTSVRWKSSVLSENVSSYFFNCILIVFYAYHCIWVSFFKKQPSDLKMILYYPQLFHTSVRWKYSVLYKKVFTSFSYIF